jgi:hypothetical protein
MVLTEWHGNNCGSTFASEREAAVWAKRGRR